MQETEPRFFWATGILKRGVKLKNATADLNVAAAGLARIYPKDYPKQFTMAITSLGEAVIADFRGALILLAAAVALLLLLSCSNAASLLLVRASGRIKEMGVRAALGASGGRLLRQSLVETLVLALVGCAAVKLVGTGMLFGFVAIVLMAPLLKSQLWGISSLDTLTVAISAIALLAAGLLACFSPALRATRVDTTRLCDSSERSRGLTGMPTRLMMRCAVIPISLARPNLIWSTWQDG